MNTLNININSYIKIIEHISDETIYGYFPNLNLDQLDRYFRHVISEPDTFMSISINPLKYLGNSQSQNPIFIYLVNNFDTLSVIKILMFNYDFSRLGQNFDYQNDLFVLDGLLNPIRAGDYVISGFFSIYKVQKITDNFKIKVRNSPGLTKKYKYYHPYAIRKMPNVTNEFS